ncbi:MAG: DUF3667 domain-containing protein [Thermoflexibacter sp.]|jgi:hypothetical protein|nr:DUF3667 domain-containing protein [Thermoflexibacter sp.]
MKELRKGKNCLNCGLELDKKYNHCPQCGQENTNNKVSLRELVMDTILNYLSFDMLFGRSLLPFLFKPGYLVKEFLEGRRVGHIHPVRLYLIVNFLFFLIFVRVVDLQTIEKKLALKDNNKPTKQKKAFVYEDGDTTQMKLKDFAKKLSIDRSSLSGDSLAIFLEKEIKKQKIPVNYQIKEVEEEDYIDIGGFGAKQTDKKGSNAFSWQRFVRHVGNKDLSPEQFLDSIGIKDKNPTTIKAASQAMKIGRNDLSMFILNIINNIPLMMILMLPLFAFYLKIFYAFSKRLYIEHLVFTFHFQSFNYVLLAIILVIFHYQKDASENHIVNILLWSMIIWTVYNAMAIKQVYAQSWLMTLFKLFWIGIFYVTTLSFFQLGVLIYSFFTY